MADLAFVPQASASRRWLRWLGGALLAASFAFIGARLWQMDWSTLEVHNSWELTGALVAACTLFSAADYTLAKAWAVLADPERRLSGLLTDRIYARGVLMKYLPGSVFQYLGRQLGGAEVGLAQGQLARSSVVEIILHVVASSSVAALCLLFAFAPGVALACFALLAAACFAIRRPVIASFALQFVAFSAIALAAAVVCWALLPAGTDPARFAALFLLAWLAGFVVPIAPGGLGVREAALIVLAGGSLPAASLLAATLALRLVSIGGDLAYGSLALIPSRLKSP